MLTKKETMLKSYIQGRYRCLACGEFDDVQHGGAHMAEFRQCPVCQYDAQLLTTARGMGIDPQVGVLLPGYMERRLGQVEKESRGVRARVGHHKRKFPNCSFCDTETFTKTGAIDFAEELRRQHGKRYQNFPCPFGPGFHVQPMEE